jgi:hypothetical protein
MDYRHGLSSRVPASQVGSSKFKPQSHQKKKKERKRRETESRGGRQKIEAEDRKDKRPVARQ